MSIIKMFLRQFDRVSVNQWHDNYVDVTMAAESGNQLLCKHLELEEPEKKHRSKIGFLEPHSSELPSVYHLVVRLKLSNASNRKGQYQQSKTVQFALRVVMHTAIQKFATQILNPFFRNFHHSTLVIMPSFSF